MSPHPPEYLRLCRLLEDSLQPFSDIAVNCLSDELEKDLLVSLSKVVEHVRNWTQQLDSDEELLTESVDIMPECSVLAGNSHCVEKFIGGLISLLALSSRYVQHLVSNTLIAISEFLIAFGYGWDDFMNFLCLCLELAICNTLSPSSVPDAPATRFSDCDLSYSKVLSKQKLGSANWSMVADIFRVLRGILKNLKPDTDEIMKVYISSVSSLILNVSWDLLADVHLDGNREVVKVSAGVVSLRMKFVHQREITVFFGHFIQFLCSLVKQASLMESGVGILPVICKVSSLVPIRVAWFHTELQSPLHVHIFHYFRHKVLMLMIKLHSHIQVEDIIILSRLHLLYQYFEDLLLQPVSKLTVDNDAALEDLPFRTSFVDQKKKDISSRHLQRLTVFMFLRCSLHLISMKKCSNGRCSSDNLEWYFTSEQKFGSECCSKSKGLLELRKWLQAHIHSTKVEGPQLYFQPCIRFTSCFLQLFMHEDDLLFEMLLQMFHLPFSPGAQNFELGSFQEVQNEQVFHVSDLFNPVYLFHLFLAEILYDHQVLLDYLISNVTGSNCAEYLLRSLRHACDSWNLLLNFRALKKV